MTKQNIERILKEKAQKILKKHDRSIEGYGIDFDYGNFIYNGNRVAFIGNINFSNSQDGYGSSEHTIISTIFTAKVDEMIGEITSLEERVTGVIKSPKTNINYIMGYPEGKLSSFRGYKITSFSSQEEIEFEELYATEIGTKPTWNGPIKCPKKIESKLNKINFDKTK